MLVALTGRAGSGKDTAAAALIDRGFMQINFADALKLCCGFMFKLTPYELHDPVGKMTKLDRWPFLSPREIFQTVGTDLMRSRFPEVWVNCWTLDVSETIDIGFQVVCTDLRFDNELQAVRALGGKVIKIERPGLERMDHVSETSVDTLEFDHLILNDSSVEALRSNLLAAL